MGELRVTQVKLDFFTVTQMPTWQNKWWTAKRLAHGWYIINKQGTVLKETAVQGRRIIKAIEEFEQTEAPHAL